MQSNGITPVKSMPKFRSKDDVATRYLADYNADVSRGNITYRLAVKKYFESFEALDTYLGIDRTPIELVMYDKDVLDTKVYDVMAIESEMISAAILDKYDANISYSIRKHYGSITDYFSQLDVDYYEKPYVPFRWGAENIKRQLMRWIREGKHVNYTYVAKYHSGIILASRKIYGGYAELFEACGLNYDDYRTDTSMASFYGRKLEDIFEEILNELSCEYEREPSVDNCRPDFVMGSDWVDIKLSEWTIHISDCDTIKKYEPHCETLTIVFLRGNKSLNKMITDKTRIVNIGFYIEQMPREKRGYFYERLDGIERELSEKEAV
ncbi:hypothetical protein [Peribacillus butanolivorans]|uniref:hypothetical protein n=1 Tax=Peribacillus butanolivorans TaxID=421767 RepID=UPI00207C5177|nr:hypothetical protein [Peribacillus butanolivorans]